MLTFIETLEERVQLSATLMPAVSATILSAEEAVTAARLQIPADTASWNKTIATDRKNIPLVRVEGLKLLRADRAQIALDRGNALKVAIDRGTLKTDTANRRVALNAAINLVSIDVGNKISAIAKDRQTYHAALRTLHADEILAR